jgi:hypothetical protein
MKAKDLQPNQYFKFIRRQRKWRQCRHVVILSDNDHIPKEYVGKLLIVKTDCRQCLCDPDEEVIVMPVRKCRICRCTDDDCRQCIEKTGEPCSWVEDDLCSACIENKN